MEKSRIKFVPPVHVWAVPERQQTVPSRTKQRQIEWHGRGRGRGAMLVTEAIESLPVTSAVFGRVQSGGALLLEVQGQADLALAERQAASLGERMKRKGLCSDTTIEEGVSAGLLALTQWRNGQAVDGSEGGANLVCWRAVQASMSQDTFGDTIELSEFTGEGLAASMLPLPQLSGDDSRMDKATRLLFERARAKRPGLLARRVAMIKAQGGRGKRAESVERVGRAALLLLQGKSIDDAASGAGFKSAGKARPGGGAVRAGDRLAQAVRRLGFQFRFNLREPEQRTQAASYRKATR
jgi:hypothetical protein